MVAIGVVIVFALVWPELMLFYRALGPTAVTDDATQAPPDRPRLRDRQGPPGLHGLHWRMGGRPHLSDPRRSRQSALVLVADRQRSDDARCRWRPLKRPRRSFKELGRLECVGEAGRGLLTSLGPLAAFSNRRRFFVNLLRGVMPFRRGRYRCWSNICGRSGGLENDFISRRFGARPTSRDEALERSAPQVPTAPHCM